MLKAVVENLLETDQSAKKSLLRREINRKKKQKEEEKIWGKKEAEQDA